MADFDRLAAASKQLLDNAAFNEVFKHIENEAVSALLSGQLGDAESNLRNVRAITFVRTAVENLSNADSKPEEE
jgi:hypothetical protein